MFRHCYSLLSDTIFPFFETPIFMMYIIDKGISESEVLCFSDEQLWPGGGAGEQTSYFLFSTALKATL